MYSHPEILLAQNLHPRLVDDKVLHSHFVQYGPILSAKVARNSRGQSRGFGFVQFERLESARWPSALDFSSVLDVQLRQASLGP